MPEKQPWEITDEILALAGIIVIALASMFWIAAEAKDIVIGAVGVLGGYVGGKKSAGGG